MRAFFRARASASEAVDVNFRWRPQLSDAKDELVLEAAVNGETGAPVTLELVGFQLQRTSVVRLAQKRRGNRAIPCTPTAAMSLNPS